MERPEGDASGDDRSNAPTLVEQAVQESGVSWEGSLGDRLKGAAYAEGDG